MKSEQKIQLLLRGNIVDEKRIIHDGWLAISDGKIVSSGRDNPPHAEQELDARGKWIIPGVIDGQVHSKSQLNQEGIGRASCAAAAGGITVMVDMPYDDPEPIACRFLLDNKIAEVKQDAHIDVALFGTLNNTYGFEAAAGLIEGGVCAFKFSTFEAAAGRFPRLDEEELEKAFRLIAPTGLVCSVHNQLQELTRKNIKKMESCSDTGWDAFFRAHTPLIENLATSLIYEIGAETKARSHAVHVSTSRGFELHRMYKEAGYPVSIETCVQYLMLNHEEHTRLLGAKTKHYPPIRQKAESELLWEHIAQDNCTFVSSDHVSWGLERKNNPDVFKNASGGPGLETLLPAFWTGCEQHNISPTTVVKMLCANPARHFLLDDRKGGFEEGMDADFVILKSEYYRYDPKNSLSAVNWSSFEGMEFSVRVDATYCRGVPVFVKGKIVNLPGSGSFLRPKNPQ